MKVWLVGAGPGDPGLLTLLGRECLEKAEVVVYDALANPAFLNLANPLAEKIYVGKIAGRHALPQEEINALLVKKAREGKNVVRLKGGDPYIFGRGGEEADYLHDHGIPFQEVPGISSAIAAPAYAGIPLTDRRAASSLSIITGHESDLNRGSHNWRAYAQSGSTLVFVMGMKNLGSICRNLLEAGLDGQTPAAVIQRGCTPAQKTVDGTVENLPQKVAEAGLANPAVIVIGKCASLRAKLAWYERLPLFGRRIVVTRARAQASSMVRALNELGAEVVECPAIRIEQLADYTQIDAAIAGLDKYAWIIFTSANGVEHFYDRLRKAGRDARALAGARVAAIGPGTAAALGAGGILADLVPARFVAESVAEALGRAQNLRGARILLARALEARDTLPDMLRQAGAEVDVCPLYQTVTGSGCADIDIAAVDCVSFASSSSVRNFLRLIPARELQNGPVLAAIGPITASALREAGLCAQIMPDEYTVPALIQAIARYFEDKK